MFKQLLLALFFSPLASAFALPVYSECNVCGDGFYVNRPKLAVNDAIAKNTTCGNLHAEGKAGMIKPSTCSSLPLVLATVGCCHALQPVCNICGDDKYVSNPAVIFDATNHPDKTCGNLKIEAESGFLSASDCSSYQSTLPGICCASNGAPSTSTTPAPTPAENTHANKGDPPTASQPTTVANKKDPNQAVSNVNGASSENSTGMSGGGKAALGVFLTFVAIGGIFVFLHKATKGTSIRTVDSAGATLEPDGSNINKETYSEGTMDEVDLNANFATERLVV